MVIDDAAFHALIDNLNDGVYFVDTKRVIQYWSTGAARITGYQTGEVCGRSCSDNILVHVNDEGCYLCKSRCPLAAAIQDGTPRTGHVYLKHKDGHRVPVDVFVAPLRDSDGRIVGGLETFHDTSDPPYDVAEIAKLRNDAYLCALTGIPNRRYVEEILPLKFEEHRRAARYAALMVIDIDHFKKVNDAYGHAAGDLVLKMVARTLSLAMRSYDLVARWGGEEFVAVMVMDRPMDIERTAERLRILVQSSSRTITRDKLQVSVSIGGVSADVSTNWREALQLADQRMYVSKRQGRNRVTVA